MFMLPNLSPSVSYDVLHTLRALTPRPVPDTLEARAHRETALLEAIAAMCPANAAEALLAADIFAASAHAKDALASAMTPNLAIEALKTYRAQAAAMLRSVQSGLRSLQLLQAERRQAEADQKPPIPNHPPDTPDLVAPPNAPVPSPAPTTPNMPVPRLSEAERYAIDFPGRAASIRAARGLPKRIDFNAPKREVIHEIVHGTSPFLRALDKPRRAQNAA